MGFIVNQLVGTAKGKIGNYVYRRKKTGESYISQLPKKYKKTKEIQAIINRKRFSMNVKFAAAVNDSPILKSIWKYAKLPGKSAYNKINKSNHHSSSDNFMYTDAHITPEGRDLGITSMQLNNDKLEIEFEVFGNIVNRFQPPYFAVAMIHLYNPVNHIKKPDNYHRFLTIEEEFSGIIFMEGKILKFKFKSEKNTFRIINDYNNVVVYFAIICKKNNIGNPDWTNSEGTIIKGLDHYNENKARIYKLTGQNQTTDTIPAKPVYNVRIR